MNPVLLCHRSICHLMLVAVQNPPWSLLHYTSIPSSLTSRAPHYAVWLYMPYKHEDLLLIVEVVVDVEVCVVSLSFCICRKSLENRFYFEQFKTINIFLMFISIVGRRTNEVNIKSFKSALVQLRVWSFPPSTHDARCYASHCVCSHHICHKCSLCNCNSKSGLLLSCLLSLSLCFDFSVSVSLFNF